MPLLRSAIIQSTPPFPRARHLFFFCICLQHSAVCAYMHVLKREYFECNSIVLSWQTHGHGLVALAPSAGFRVESVAFCLGGRCWPIMLNIQAPMVIHLTVCWLQILNTCSCMPNWGYLEIFFHQGSCSEDSWPAFEGVRTFGTKNHAGQGTFKCECLKLIGLVVLSPKCIFRSYQYRVSCVVTQKWT